MSMLLEGVDMPRGTNMMLLISPDGEVWEMGDLLGNDKLIDGAKAVPAADVRPVLLCRDCVHYEMGVCLKIYDDGAANKDAWQERKPDDYCSYGEDRNVPSNCRTEMRPTSMSGANGEGKL